MHLPCNCPSARLLAVSPSALVRCLKRRSSPVLPLLSISSLRRPITRHLESQLTVVWRVFSRFPWVDTVLRRLFPCCQCAQADPAGPLTRIGTQYTFMSAESKRTTISTGRTGSLANSGRHGSLDVSRRLLPAARRPATNDAVRRDV